MERLPTLKGERVSLRQMEAEDALAVFALFGDPEVTAWMGIETRRDEAHAGTLIDEIQDLTRKGTLFQWGTTKNDDGRVIGTVTLASIDGRNRRAEIGFAMASAHQGRGYATEAARLAVAYAFGEMGLHRLEADVDPRNAPSLAVLERLGFEREGYMRDRWLIDEQWQDTVFFGLLAKDREA